MNRKKSPPTHAPIEKKAEEESETLGSAQEKTGPEQKEGRKSETQRRCGVLESKFDCFATLDLQTAILLLHLELTGLTRQKVNPSVGRSISPGRKQLCYTSKHRQANELNQTDLNWADEEGKGWTGVRESANTLHSSRGFTQAMPHIIWQLRWRGRCCRDCGVLYRCVVLRCDVTLWKKAVEKRQQQSNQLRTRRPRSPEPQTSYLCSTVL